jgi:hypothetical protein
MRVVDFAPPCRQACIVDVLRDGLTSQLHSNALPLTLFASAQKASRSAPIFTGAMASLYYPMGGAVGALTVVGLCTSIRNMPAGSS